jgi:hypothetical protein
MNFFRMKRTELEAPAEVAIDTLDEEGARDDDKQVAVPTTEPGVSGIEAAQALWGQTGRWLVIVG